MFDLIGNIFPIQLFFS